MMRPAWIAICALCFLGLTTVVTPVEAGHGIPDEDINDDKSVLISDWAHWFEEMPDINNEESYQELFSGDKDGRGERFEGAYYFNDREFYEDSIQELEDSNTKTFDTQDEYRNSKFNASEIRMNASIPIDTNITLKIAETSGSGEQTIVFDGGYRGQDEIVTYQRYRSDSLGPEKRYEVTATLERKNEDTDTPRLEDVTLFEEVPNHRYKDFPKSNYPTRKIEKYHDTVFESYDDLSRDTSTVVTPRLPASKYADKQVTPSGSSQYYQSGSGSFALRDVYVNISSINPSTVVVPNKSENPALRAARSGTVRVSYGGAAKAPDYEEDNVVKKCATDVGDIDRLRDRVSEWVSGLASAITGSISGLLGGDTSESDAENAVEEYLDKSNTPDSVTGLSDEVRCNDGDKKYIYSVDGLSYDIRLSEQADGNSVQTARHPNRNSGGVAKLNYDFSDSLPADKIGGLKVKLNATSTVEREVEVYNVTTSDCPASGSSSGSSTSTYSSGTSSSSGAGNASTSTSPPSGITGPGSPPSGITGPGSPPSGGGGSGGGSGGGTYSGPQGCDGPSDTYISDRKWEDDDTKTKDFSKEVTEQEDLIVPEPPERSDYDTHVLHRTNDTTTVRVDSARDNNGQNPTEELWTKIITSGVGAAGQGGLSPGEETSTSVSTYEPIDKQNNPNLKLWLRGDFGTADNWVTVRIDGTPVPGWDQRDITSTPDGYDNRRGYPTVDLSSMDIEEGKSPDLTVETGDGAVEGSGLRFWYELQANDKYRADCSSDSASLTTPEDDICSTQSSTGRVDLPPGLAPASPGSVGGASPSDTYISSPTVVESFWQNTFYRQARWDVLQRLEKNCGELSNSDKQRNCHDYRELGTTVDGDYDAWANGNPNERVDPIYPSPTRPLQSLLLPVNSSISAKSYGQSRSRTEVTNVNTTDSVSYREGSPDLNDIRYCPFEKFEKGESQWANQPPDVLTYYTHNYGDEKTTRCHRPRYPGIRTAPDQGATVPEEDNGQDVSYRTLDSVTFNTEASPTRLRVSEWASWRSYELPIDKANNVYHETPVTIGFQRVDGLSGSGGSSVPDTVSRRVDFDTTAELPSSSEYLSQSRLRNANKVQVEIQLSGEEGEPISTKKRGQLSSRLQSNEYISVRNNISGRPDTETHTVQTNEQGLAYLALKSGDTDQLENVTVKFNTHDEWWQLPSQMRVLESDTLSSQQTQAQIEDADASPALILAGIILSLLTVVALGTSTLQPQQSFRKSFKQAVGTMSSVAPDYTVPIIGVYVFVQIFIDSMPNSMRIMLGILLVLYFIMITRNS